MHANTLQIMMLKQHQVLEQIKIVMQGEFPGDPVAETPHSQCWGPDSILGQGTRSHMLQLRQVALVVKNPPDTAGDVRDGIDPWVGKSLRRRAQQPTPVFLPGESHGQRSLVGYGP